MVAEDAYPSLDIAAYLLKFDAMAKALQSRLAPDSFAEQRIAVLNAYLFDELQFRGNAAYHYDPRNSFLNEVLDRRVGLPITLSIVYLELGRRIGLPVHGVSFPGHFLVKVRLRRGQLVLDPFQRGVPQSDDDLRQRLAQFMPQGQMPLSDLVQYLEAASPRDIVVRVLRNLKAVYFKAGKLNEALAVTNRLLLAAPDMPEELRDRGLLYAQLECFRPAAADLQNYLRRQPNGADAQDIRAKLMALQKAAARLN